MLKWLTAKFGKARLMRWAMTLYPPYLGAGVRVRDVSVAVREGEISGLAGLLGSGRTETARLIFGADRMERGTIRMQGQDRSYREPADAIVLGNRVVAELGHLAQYSPAASATPHPGQRLQTGPHRVRIGVVGVVDHGDAVGAGAHLHPVPRGRPGAGKGFGDLTKAGSALECDRRRGQ